MYSIWNTCIKDHWNMLKFPFFQILYRNTPPGNGLQSSMELLSARQARIILPMWHVASMQVGQVPSIPQAKAVRQTIKNQVQTPSNLLSFGTHVMYKTPPSKLWYPRIGTSILQDSGPYIITESDGTTYRWARFLLKPYKQNINCRIEVST